MKTKVNPVVIGRILRKIESGQMDSVKMEYVKRHIQGSQNTKGITKRHLFTKLLAIKLIMLLLF